MSGIVSIRYFFVGDEVCLFSISGVQAHHGTTAHHRHLHFGATGRHGDWQVGFRAARMQGDGAANLLRVIEADAIRHGLSFN